jgi:hypothetical protein
VTGCYRQACRAVRGVPLTLGMGIQDAFWEEARLRLPQSAAARKGRRSQVGSGVGPSRQAVSCDPDTNLRPERLVQMPPTCPLGPASRAVDKQTAARPDGGLHGVERGNAGSVSEGARRLRAVLSGALLWRLSLPGESLSADPCVVNGIWGPAVRGPSAPRQRAGVVAQEHSTARGGDVE